MGNEKRYSTDQTTFSRRKLLELTGCAGAVAALGACSSDATDSSPASNTTLTPKSASAPLPPSAIPVAPPSPQTPAVSRPLLCRDSWGAQPIRPGGKEHVPVRMTLHHSEVVFEDNRTITARLRQHQHYHQDEHGWIDIAYHVAVDREGNLFALRPTNLVGNTATDYDPTGHFLVLIEGDFEKQPVNEMQLDGAAIAFAWAAQTWGITSSTLMGHRDVPAKTTCPGANLEAHISSGDLKKRVDDLLIAGPVELRAVCGPEADTIVNKIEAGN